MPTINTIETAALFQKACDQQLIEGATSGWMEENAARYKYTGGREIKIPTITTSGLGNYDRGGGYPKGKVGVTYQTKVMTMDRGVEFLLDRVEVDESGVIATATNAMSAFQSENVIPEIDAYRYSTIYQLAAAAGYGKEYTPAASTILGKLKADITAIRDTCGGSVELVIIMPYPYTICCWNCASGSKGSYNFSPAYIQFEICEDALDDPDYFTEAFALAAKLCARLMKNYNIPLENGNLPQGGSRARIRQQPRRPRELAVKVRARHGLV